MERQPEFKSPQNALFLSLGGTLIPSVIGASFIISGNRHDDMPLLITGIALPATGWVFGPSAGHFYAKQISKGWKGLNFAWD
jgi:hypothetical protein